MMRVFQRAAITAALMCCGLVGTAQAEPRNVWFDQVTARIGSLVKVPKEAKGLKESRVAIVRFKVDRSGRIDGPFIFKSTGADVFDKAALNAVKAADPLPPPPLPETMKSVGLSAPIRFRASSRVSLERAKRSIQSICTGC